VSKSFTSLKLDWINALMSDSKISSTAFRVGFCIIQHVNEHTGLAFVSDETISDKTATCNRQVREARNLLRDKGWLIWKRTRTANRYRLLANNLNAIIDEQIIKKELRIERRDRRKTAEPKLPDRRDSAVLDGRISAEQERRDSADIHLMVNTVEVTPKERGPTAKKVLVVEGGIPLHIIGTTLGTC
jgi:hypothetical protein